MPQYFHALTICNFEQKVEEIIGVENINTEIKRHADINVIVMRMKNNRYPKIDLRWTTQEQKKEKELKEHRWEQ